MNIRSSTLISTGGVLGALLLAAGIIITGSAGTIDAVEGFYNADAYQSLVADLTENSTAFVIGSWLVLGSLPLLAVFAIGMANHVGPHDPIVQTGAALFITGVAVSAMGWVLLAGIGMELNSTNPETTSIALRTGFLADWLATGLIFAGGNGLLAFAARRTEALPPWLTTAGIVIALVWMTRMLVMGIEPLRNVTAVAAPAGIIWFFAVGIVALRATAHHAGNDHAIATT